MSSYSFQVLIHCTRGDNRAPAVAAAALAAFYGFLAAVELFKVCHGVSVIYVMSTGLGSDLLNVKHCETGASFSISIESCRIGSFCEFLWFQGAIRVFCFESDQRSQRSGALFCRWMQAMGSGGVGIPAVLISETFHSLR